MSDRGWIKWDGGDCPVDRGATVCVHLRGGERRDYARARFFRWHHAPEDRADTKYDIIAYRVVSE